MKRRHRSIDQPIINLATHQARHVTVAVLCDYLEVDRGTIMRMIKRGALGAFKAGREWRIPIEDVQQVFASRSTQLEQWRD